MTYCGLGLANVPGPGTPTNDGPSNLNYGWDWSTGGFTEGTWNPRLTVYDNSGLTAVQTMFIGIDRTGPTIGSVTTGSSSGWSTSSSVTLSGLINSVDDGLGSGVAYTEISLDENSWTQISSNTHTLTLPDGTHTIYLRLLITLVISEQLPNLVFKSIPDCHLKVIGRSMS